MIHRVVRAEWLSDALVGRCRWHHLRIKFRPLCSFTILENAKLILSPGYLDFKCMLWSLSCIDSLAEHVIPQNIRVVRQFEISRGDPTFLSPARHPPRIVAYCTETAPAIMFDYLLHSSWSLGIYIHMSGHQGTLRSNATSARDVFQNP